MAPARRSSNASSNLSSMPERDQELGSMYDYLAKVILLGPSGSGKSCLLHRFVKNEWRVLTSQTIGVEFASKIVRVGTGARRTRVKLQLWDTAGTERFRSVSRSYYRGAAGAILVYDVSARASFDGLPTFLTDARALAGPDLTLLLAGNKIDVESSSGGSGGGHLLDDETPPSSLPSSRATDAGLGGASLTSSGAPTPNLTPAPAPDPAPGARSSGVGARLTATVAPAGRAVGAGEAAAWASAAGVPVAVEVSALDGRGVDALFERLARTILAKIELGEIDPDDPASGIQYGDAAWGEHADGAGSSMRSGRSGGGGDGSVRRRGRRRAGTGGWGGGGGGGLREWEAVFRLDRRRRGGCAC